MRAKKNTFLNVTVMTFENEVQALKIPSIN